jgi:predicted flap endonuclease-1-like 5' DNA nuclease
MFRKLSVLIVLLLAALAMGGFAHPSLAAAEQEGNPWWLWIIVFVVLAGFVVFMLWWWVRDGGEEEGIAPPRSAKAQPPGPSAPQEVTSITPESAQPAQEDDLKKIEGIGPKIAGVLKEAGIRSFGQLAAADAGSLEDVLGKADPNLLRLADPATWPEQAALAAEGRWEDLEKFQANLKGGRRRKG